MSSRHQQSNFFDRRNFRINFADNASVVNNQQSIGKRRDFFKLGRHQQHRATRVAQANQLAMNKLDGADINTSRGLRNQQELRINFELSADDQLLLVTARESARGKIRIRGTNVKALDDFICARANSFIVQETPA